MQTSLRRRTSAILAVLLFATSIGTVTGAPSPSPSARAALASAIVPPLPTPPSPQRRALSLPLWFEPNVGQLSDGSEYVANAEGYRVELAPATVDVTLASGLTSGSPSGPASPASKPPAASSVSMTLVGGATVGWREGAAASGVSNYLTSTASHRGVAHASSLSDPGVYPGIDLTADAASGEPEFGFLLHPGAKPSTIAMHYSGETSLSLDAGGDLLVATAAGSLTVHRPTLYQPIDGGRLPVSGHFVVTGDLVHIAVGPDDPLLPLVIDPTIGYVTPTAGLPLNVAASAGGDVFITGNVSSGLPNGSDAFVEKLDTSGNAVYFTVVGADGFTQAEAIAVDGSESAFVTGLTDALLFPTSAGAIESRNPRALADPQCAFAFRLNPDGATLAYSTYLGGKVTFSTGQGIALDSSDDAVIAGEIDLYSVMKIDPTGSAILYETGSTWPAYGRAIAVDSAGNAYAALSTFSNRQFPTTAGAYQTAPPSTAAPQAVIARLDTSGNLAWATYLAGSMEDDPFGITTDQSGDVYVTGYTVSTDFPTTAGVLQRTAAGGGDAFVSELNATGSAVVASTYLGGSGWDQGNSVAVDTGGAIYVEGYTRSANFPLDRSLFQSPPGASSAFLSKLNPTMSAFDFSTYVGATAAPPTHMALDAQDSAYIILTGTVSAVVKISDAPATSGEPLGGPVSPTMTLGNGNPAAVNLLGCQGNATCSPINTASGNFWHSFNDIQVAGPGVPLTFTRTYNSLDASQDGPVGYGWSTSLSLHLVIDPATGNVTVVQENGSEVPFTPSGSGFQTLPRFDATLTRNNDGSYTFTRSTTEVFRFSPAGLLLAVSDPNGYADTLSYDPAGHVSAVTDSAGRRLTFVYEGTHISAVVDPLGLRVAYGYDAAGDLVTATDQGGGVSHYTYDASHRMLTLGDARGGVVTNQYDGSGRVLAQTDQLGRLTTFAYSGDALSSRGGACLAADPAGHLTLEQYRYGTRILLTRGYGTSQAATWTMAYDPATLGLTSLTDPNGNTQTATYDAHGNPLTRTDALNRTTTFSWDSRNDLTSITDPTGIATSFGYDTRGNLLERSRPLTTTGQIQATVFHYDDPGLPGVVTSVTDPDGGLWRFAHDTAGNVTATTDPLGNVDSASYNLDGWMMSFTSARGNLPGANAAAFTTTIVRDSFGQPTVIVDPLGDRSTYAYDPDHNLIAVTDANGHETRYTDDAANEQIAVARADGSVLRSTYHPDGTLAQQVDGAGNATSYGEDALGRTDSITDPLGRTTTSAYDGVGNLLSITDPQGQTTGYGYDQANQLQTITYSDGRTPAVSMAYDLDGRRVVMVDGTGGSQWSWDSLNRMTSSRDGAGALLQYGYDLRNQVVALTMPGGQRVARGFDAAGHMVSVSDWLGHTSTFAYDADGNLASETVPGVVDTFTHDQADRLTSIVDQHSDPTDSDGRLLASFTYGRDPAGLVSGVDVAGRSPQPDQQLGYTSLNQILSVAGPHRDTDSYAYDHADNLIQLIDGTTLRYDSANELLQAGAGSSTSSYAYDPRGDRVAVTPATGAAESLSYDQASRLVGVTGSHLSAGYAYNGDGLRTDATVNGNRRHEVWDVAAGLPLLLQDGPTAFVTGPSGLPLEQIDAKGSALFFHQDQLGSTALLTSASGHVAGRFAYDPYGNAIKHSGPASSIFGFAGQITDNETGFQYLRTRYYDPATGQFLTRDPAAILTRSPYAYAHGDPANLTDASGLDPSCDLNPFSSSSCLGVGATYVRNCTVIGAFSNWAVSHPGDAILMAISLLVPGGEEADLVVGGERLAADSADSGLVNLASDARTNHILNGDATGGGHLWPGLPGKTPFPADWSGPQIMNAASDIATDPAATVISNVGGRTVLVGERDGVPILVVTDGRDIITAYPTNLPRNP